MDRGTKNVPVGAYVADVISEEDDKSVIETASKRFEEHTHNNLTIIKGYSAWGSNFREELQPFPKVFCDAVKEHGAIPLIAWEPWHFSRKTDEYLLDQINRGDFDVYIEKWANEAKKWGFPIYVELMHEPNNKTYPWGGHLNGGNKRAYIEAFRHIVQKFNAAGAKNVKFVFAPDVRWSGWKDYFPGKEYVSVIGLHGFDFGGNRSFKDLFGQAAEDAKDLIGGKKVMVTECATTAPDKQSWLDEARSSASEMGISAVVWFNKKSDRDWVIPRSQPPKAIAPSGRRQLEDILKNIQHRRSSILQQEKGHKNAKYPLTASLLAEDYRKLRSAVYKNGAFDGTAFNNDLKWMKEYLPEDDIKENLDMLIEQTYKKVIDAPWDVGEWVEIKGNGFKGWDQAWTDVNNNQYLEAKLKLAEHFSDISTPQSLLSALNIYGTLMADISNASLDHEYKDGFLSAIFLDLAALTKSAAEKGNSGDTVLHNIRGLNIGDSEWAGIVKDRSWQRLAEYFLKRSEGYIINKYKGSFMADVFGKQSEYGNSVMWRGDKELLLGIRMPGNLVLLSHLYSGMADDAASWIADIDKIGGKKSVRTAQIGLCKDKVRYVYNNNYLETENNKEQAALIKDRHSVVKDIAYVLYAEAVANKKIDPKKLLLAEGFSRELMAMGEETAGLTSKIVSREPLQAENEQDQELDQGTLPIEQARSLSDGTPDFEDLARAINSANVTVEFGMKNEYVASIHSLIHSLKLAYCGASAQVELPKKAEGLITLAETISIVSQDQQLSRSFRLSDDDSGDLLSCFNNFKDALKRETESAKKDLDFEKDEYKLIPNEKKARFADERIKTAKKRMSEARADSTALSTGKPVKFQGKIVAASLTKLARLSKELDMSDPIQFAFFACELARAIYNVYGAGSFWTRKLDGKESEISKLIEVELEHTDKAGVKNEH